MGDDVSQRIRLTAASRGPSAQLRTKIDNLVQIAHNNEVGKHCILCGQVALAGSCKLEDYVMLGGNVGLADHTSMGKGSRAGAKSGISGHIPAGQEVWGLFAREKKEIFRSYAALRHLPELAVRVKKLEKALNFEQPE
jgi:UDP-3-O-[3-hydroxymyristoyl] glucosamine N-acyltransferase